MALEPGTLLEDRYEIVRSLKSGGMGAVYEARDRRLANSPCAVKEMLDCLIASSDSELIRRKFAEETQVLSQLAHHGIPRVRDFFSRGPTLYIVMDLVQGASLDQELADSLSLAGQPFSTEAVVDVGLQVLDVLDYLHRLSPPVIHRDLKPANIIRDFHTAKIKVVDFGLARSLSPGPQQSQTVVGTLVYAPMEQLQGKAEPRSDLYSLGVTMQELLTGQTPEMLANPPMRELMPDLDPGLADILDRARQTRPEDRFPDASSLRQALLDWRQSQQSAGERACPTTPLIRDAPAQVTSPLPRPPTPLPKPTPAPPPPPARPSRRGCVALLIGVLVVGLLLSRGHRYRPASGPMAERREALMLRLETQPYPPTGPDHYLGQALGAYWVGEAATGDKAIADLKDYMAGAPAKEVDNFYSHAYLLERLLFLFGHRGFYHHQMSAGAEATAQGLIWAWLSPRASRARVDPSHDWWIWKNEQDHLQESVSMWGGLAVLRHSEFASKTLDGSTLAQLQKAYEDYFCRWFRERAGKGMWVQCNSPALRYAQSGLYNLVDFGEDRELRRLAREFLDLSWTQWALEQLQGQRGGSRIHCANGSAAVIYSTMSDEAWYLFGVGSSGSAFMTTWCLATSSYAPGPWLTALVQSRDKLGAYTLLSRLPGGVAPQPQQVPESLDPRAVMQLDPACPSLLRETYVTPQFVMGVSMAPALPRSQWAAISSMGHWDGVLFAGRSNPVRLFFQGLMPDRGQPSNSQTGVGSKGVLVVQKLPDTNVPGVGLWASDELKVSSLQEWQFFEAPQAFAAVRVIRGQARWERDRAERWNDPTRFKPAGQWLICSDPNSPILLEVVPKSAYPGMADFQKAVLGNSLVLKGAQVDYTSSYYQTHLTWLSDFSKAPQIDGQPLEYSPSQAYSGGVLEGDFGGRTVRLKALGATHEFRF